MNHVEGRHGQARSIDHTADISIQAHVGKVDFVRGPLPSIFLVGIAEFSNLRVPVECVVVEIYLAVESDKPTILGHHQRVDLDLTAILGEIEIKEPSNKGNEFINLLGRQAQVVAQGSTLVIPESHVRFNMNGMDLLGVRGRNLLDLHSTLGGSHDRKAFNGSIEQNGQIKFIGDGRASLDVDLPHAFSFGPGLRCVQGHAEYFARGLLSLCRRLRQLHSPSLAPASRVDLGLDHDHRGTQGARGLFGLGWRRGKQALGHGYTELPEQRLGLIFVNVHRKLPLGSIFKWEQGRDRAHQSSIWATSSFT